jgi:hypothetical protein
MNNRIAYAKQDTRTAFAAETGNDNQFQLHSRALGQARLVTADSDPMSLTPGPSGSGSASGAPRCLDPPRGPPHSAPEGASRPSGDADDEEDEPDRARFFRPELHPRLHEIRVRLRQSPEERAKAAALNAARAEATLRRRRCEAAAAASAGSAASDGGSS